MYYAGGKITEIPRKRGTMTTKKKKSKAVSKPKKRKAPTKAKPIKAVKPGKSKPAKPGRSKAKPAKPGRSKSKPAKPGRSKAVSRELKEFLKDQGLTLREFNKQSRKIQREYKDEFKETRPQQGDAGEWYYPNTKALNQDYKNVKVASYRHSTYESALNWWKGVTGGAGYFVILRKKSKKTGKELFFVMDIDPNRRRKGTSKKVSDYQSDRALKLEEKFREAEDY